MAFTVKERGDRFTVGQSGIRIIGELNSPKIAVLSPGGDPNTPADFRHGTSFTDAGTAVIVVDDPRQEFTMTAGEEVYVDNSKNQAIYLEY